MVGSDHDFNWHHGYTGNAAERAAFANGHASRDDEVAKLEAEILRLRAALDAVFLHMIQITGQCMTARGILAGVLDDK